MPADVRRDLANFRLLTRNSTDLITRSTPEGRYLYVSPASVPLLGFQPQEMEGKDAFTFFHPEDQRALRASHGVTKTVPDVTTTVHRHRRADGSFCWLETTARAVRGDSGQVVEIQTASRDVTDRIRAEQALADSENRFRKLADSAPVGIFLTDEAGRCTYVNAEWSRIVGLDEQDALGNGWERIIHPEDSPRVKELWATSVREGSDFALRFRAGALGTLWVDARAAPFTGSEGPPHGYIGTLTDITQQIVAEETLASARDRALEVSRLKSDFLANMSHEIRTPLNAIIGMTGLLLETELSGEQRDYSEAVNSAGEALLEIINDILDFSRIEAGKMRLELMDFELRTLVADVADMLAPRAHKKNLELATIVHRDIPPLFRGDPGRLRQVLTNLLGNAVKFTDHGEVVVRVRALSKEEERTRLRFEVVDTGIGISEPESMRLFQPFEQVDTSAARRFGGTGLGLAISRQLVEMMGGEIGVRSEPGKGSTFWFTVELPHALSRISVPRADLGGLRVLIVDDNATNRTILEHQLQAYGITTECAFDGPGALQAIEGNHREGRPFDVALLDFDMPEMDGLALSEAIAANQSVPTPELILLTSSGRRIDLDLDKTAFSARLTKPVHEARLAKCIGTVMGIRPAESAATTRSVGLFGKRRSGAGRILVAEDTPVNQLVASRILEKLGYEVDLAADGEEALARIARKRYDAVLMDCQMPNLDGYEATRRLREQEQRGERAAPPINAMTASAMQGDRERCLEAGMNDYISKPVRPEELAAVLSYWLSPTEPHLRALPEVLDQAEVSRGS